MVNQICDKVPMPLKLKALAGGHAGQWRLHIGNDNLQAVRIQLFQKILLKIKIGKILGTLKLKAMEDTNFEIKIQEKFLNMTRLNLMSLDTKVILIITDLIQKKPVTIINI